MKRKKLIVGLFSVLGMAAMSNSLFAQQNLGAACGCPTVSTRTTAAITSVGTWTTLPASAYGKELQGNQNITLTCDKIWTLDEKLYIASGSTLTIEPGTVIKGSTTTNVSAARALIIERGGKIMAAGIEDCPIVFTAAADPLDGSYKVNNKGQWGGVLICGKATNNLLLTPNGPFVPGQGGKLAVANGLGVLEGFASSYTQDQFGVAGATAGTASATSPTGTYSGTFVAGPTATWSLTTNGVTTNYAPNTVGQKRIALVGNSVPVYLSAGQSVYDGSTLLGTIAGITAGTSSGTAYTAYITLVANLTQAVTAGSTLTFTDTYPNPGVTGLFSVVSTATSANGPIQETSTGSGIYVNFAGPYITGSAAFDDEDNSGVMTYVSIRHSGANLLVGSEINGLTLASVGRGTKIEHIEIVSCADDNIEIFGGTVDLKYCTTLFGNDDMFDYDLGWTGRAQFLFGMKADATSNVSADNDNGIEADSDDNKSYATPLSTPTIYNMTIMGNAKSTLNSDNSGIAGLQLKEFTGGDIRNSIIAGFKTGVQFATTTTATGSVGTRGLNMGGEAVNNYLSNGTTASATTATTGNGSQSLKVKCNTFVGNTVDILPSSGATFTAVQTQLATDGNIFTPSMTGFSTAFALDPVTYAVTTKNDAVPALGQAALGSGCAMAPYTQGFFEAANYRGAFEPNNKNENWLSDWSYSQVLGATLGVTFCPTDLNGDGTTNTADFLLFAPAFGTNCN